MHGAGQRAQQDAYGIDNPRSGFCLFVSVTEWFLTVIQCSELRLVHSQHSSNVLTEVFPLVRAFVSWACGPCVPICVSQGRDDRAGAVLGLHWDCTGVTLSLMESEMGKVILVKPHACPLPEHHAAPHQGCSGTAAVSKVLGPSQTLKEQKLQGEGV